KRLSRVQAVAMEILLVSQERRKARDFVDRFKLALVGNDPGTWVDKVFPDWAVPKTENPSPSYVQYVDEVTEEDLIDTEGEWRFKEVISPEEAERVLAEMARNPKGSFGVDELGEDEDWV